MRGVILQMNVWPPRVIVCPYCDSYHPANEAESNCEDVFYLYATCPEVGEVRLKHEFQDRFKRLKEVAIIA